MKIIKCCKYISFFTKIFDLCVNIKIMNHNFEKKSAFLKRTYFFQTGNFEKNTEFLKKHGIFEKDVLFSNGEF